MESVYTVDHVELRTLEATPAAQLAIFAVGTTRSAGWENARLEPRVYTGGQPKDGILDFDFVATPPEFGAEVISPIAAAYVMPTIPAWLKGVRVHSETNKEEASI